MTLYLLHAALLALTAAVALVVRLLTPGAPQ